MSKEKKIIKVSPSCKSIVKSSSLPSSNQAGVKTENKEESPRLALSKKIQTYEGWKRGMIKARKQK